MENTANKVGALLLPSTTAFIVHRRESVTAKPHALSLKYCRCQETQTQPHYPVLYVDSYCQMFQKTGPINKIAPPRSLFESKIILHYLDNVARDIFAHGTPMENKDINYVQRMTN